MIGTFKYRGHAGLLLEARHAAGDDNAAGPQGCFVAAVDFRYQFMDMRIILTLRDHRELIAADSENRTVLKRIADGFAGVAYSLISCLMSETVIDFFQSVHIKYHNGKRGLAVVFDLVVYVCLCL